MRIAIVGGGALGCSFAAILTRAGHDVTVVARGTQLAALRERPLRLSSHHHGELEVPLKVIGDASEGTHAHLVILAVKGQDVEAALPSLTPFVGPETAVLTLQNGVDARDQARAFLGDGVPVWPASVYLLARIDAPGAVVQPPGPNRIVFGDPKRGANAPLEAVASVLRAAGIEAIVAPRIELAIWEKFGSVTGWNGVLSVTRQPTGPILADPVTAQFLLDAIAEAYAVGRARGVELDPDLAERQMVFLKTFPASATGSMALDLFAGRPLELDSLTGAVVRLGREVGVPTPMNTAIYAALRPYVKGNRPNAEGSTT